MFKHHKMGGYPSKQTEITKAENVNRETLNNHSFSVMNIHGASSVGGGFASCGRSPASLPGLRGCSLQRLHQESQTQGGDDTGHSQAVKSGLRLEDEVALKRGVTCGGALFR